MRIRNARPFGATTDAARVHEHQVSTCGHGEHIYRANLGGPGGEYRLLEVPICEYAMRGSPRPHPTLLMSSNTKWAYAVTKDMFIAGISECPGVRIVYWRSHFANYAMRASRRPHPTLLVSSKTKWTYAVTVNMSIVGFSEGPESRPGGGEYRLLEVQICEYAMRGSPRAHPALLVPLCTK